MNKAIQAVIEAAKDHRRAVLRLSGHDHSEGCVKTETDLCMIVNEFHRTGWNLDVALSNLEAPEVPV